MSSNIETGPIRESEYQVLSVLVGELLNEIMERIGIRVFNFDRQKTEERIRKLIAEGKYWVFVARDSTNNSAIGFVSLYESYALYSEGPYGTMPELYVKKGYRSQSVGQLLVNEVIKFAQEKGWHRVEVTPPPLPAFDRTVSFYQKNGFEITGGKKLKIEIPGT